MYYIKFLLILSIILSQRYYNQLSIIQMPIRYQNLGNRLSNRSMKEERMEVVLQTECQAGGYQSSSFELYTLLKTDNR